jgi:hypothetical protein
VGLAKYLLRRLGAGLLAMLGVSVLVFLMLHVVPGDPVDHLAGGEATPDQRKKIEACMGLDQPMYVQFGTFLEHVVDGSLGHQCPRSQEQAHGRRQDRRRLDAHRVAGHRRHAGGDRAGDPARRAGGGAGAAPGSTRWPRSAAWPAWRCR